MKILVTGGAGFVGSNLVKKLTQLGHETTVLDNLLTGSRANIDEQSCEFIEGSILDVSAVNRAARGKDAIVHLAALPSVPRSVVDPIASHHANTTGTLHVLQAAREEGAQVIFSSSSSVYGRNPTMPKTETLRPEPMSPYAVSKLSAESYTLAFSECYGVDVLPFRFFNVYGPAQAPNHAYAAVIPNFVYAALNDQPLLINGDGSQSRDFTYVGTVVDILATAVERRTRSSIAINLAYGGRTTLRELVKEIEQITGNSLEVQHREPRTGEVPHSQADSTLLSSLFPGIRPTSLRVGLEQTIEWMRTLSPVH